jgi:hypothetical protein
VLEVKKNTGFNREAYLKFDLGAVGSIAGAKLRLYGGLTDTQNPSVPLAVYGAANTSWGETTLTWNNRPSTGAQLAAFTVAGTTPKWYEVDVTAYLKAEKAAGRNVVTLVLKGTQVTNAVCAFNSDEAAANRPNLSVTR